MQLRFDPQLRWRPQDGQVQVWGPRRATAWPLNARDLPAVVRAVVDGELSELGAPAVEALQRAGLLVDATKAGEANEAPIDLPPATLATAPLPPDRMLSVCTALRAEERGWVAWSPRCSAYVRLPPAVAAALLGPPGRGTVAEWRAALEPVPTQVECLLDLGLLWCAPEGPPVPPVAGSAVVHGAVRLGQGDPFAGLVADGRVPIYFVTHHVDHLPLALGMLRAALIAHRGGALLKHYQPLPIVALEVPALQALFGRFGPGVWLFSDYMWSIDFNRALSAAVKAASRRNLTVHGGPSAPKYAEACAEFMRAEPHVDIVVRGEGEATLCELLETLAGEGGWQALDTVAGITFFRDRERRAQLVRTAERARIDDIDALPSPYLADCFDHYGGGVVAAILETNRGCPFACTFCDWGSATASKIRRFDLERVKAEIDWIGRRGVRVLWIADANFGIFARDIEIAAHIAATKARYGAPREVVVNYPKNATDKIAEIVGIFASAGICGQGIVSIQTTDPATLVAIRRDNIKTRKYDELGEIFRRENLPLATDLMIGLPGATVNSFKADLQYYFDDDVGVKAYRTQLLPNSPMADPAYLREHAIRVDATKYLIATRSYDERDLQEMLDLWAAFDLADGYAVLRYALRYLQWDHGLAATEVLHALVLAVREVPERWPLMAWMLRHFLRERRVLEGWRPFYREFARFAVERFGVAETPDWACVLRVSELMMPAPGRRLPERHELPFDVAAWFAAHVGRGAASAPPLREHPPGELAIEDPFRMCEIDYSAIEQYDNHQVFFELTAAISRRRSAPSFVDQAVAA
jgi:radical SAM superfamily enzyme YgiQ (UPF0313 family)